MSEELLPIPQNLHNAKRISIEHILGFQPQNTRHTSAIYDPKFFSQDILLRRNRSSQVLKVKKIEKDQIFNLVYRFLGHIITDSCYLKSLFIAMGFKTESSSLTLTQIISSELDGDDSDSENQTVQEKEAPILVFQKEKKSDTQKKKAKVSLFVQESLEKMESDHWLSSQQLLSLRNIQFPKLFMSVQMVQKIYQEPEPFLVNLSLCLMVKFLFFSKIKVDFQNSSWILSVSTIIAYKIYYDEPVQGLIDSFSRILEIKEEETKQLERYFLQAIGFQAVITNEQYHTMLSKVLQE